MSPHTTSNYYTIAELAGMSGLHRNTIKGYILKGRIRGFKLSGRTGYWLIPLPDGDAFLEAIAKPVAS